MQANWLVVFFDTGTNLIRSHFLLTLKLSLPRLEIESRLLLIFICLFDPLDTLGASLKPEQARRQLSIIVR